MDPLSQRWVRYQRYQRQKARLAQTHLTCPSCSRDLSPDIDLDTFKSHVLSDTSSHQAWPHDDAIADAFQQITLSHKKTVPSREPDQVKSSRKRPSPEAEDVQDITEDEATPAYPTPAATEEGPRGTKKICSPPASDVQQRGSSPPSSAPGRPRTADFRSDQGKERSVKGSSGRQLWYPNDPIPKKIQQNPNSQQQQHQARSGRGTVPNLGPAPSSPEPFVMIKQPETRPISQEQLIAEVKGIYAGLVMVESKCIEVDATNQDPKRVLTTEQWQALIALHRTLLHEHHDFFLASQHPSAKPALRYLAVKYAMPARMWRHGIHSFLELLRRKLPSSLEHMLTFIYLAYNTLELLYETVPDFAETWIECLGDLGRYRMAIEDEDVRDRETWTGVSRFWYSKASDRQPHTGRLYHHLAILSRHNILQQTYYYNKSLCVLTPFASARESIMTLYDPLLAGEHQRSRLLPIDGLFVRIHGSLFSGKCTDSFEKWQGEYLDLLDLHIAKCAMKWLEAGYQTGIVLTCSLLGYGADNSRILRAIKPLPDDVVVDDSPGKLGSHADTMFGEILDLATRTFELVVQRWGDTNTLTFVHTIMAFLAYLAEHPSAMAHIEDKFPWQLTADMLNHHLRSSDAAPRFEQDEFPAPEKDSPPRPLPEDYALRGLTYVDDYFPIDWFDSTSIDEDERYLERGSMINERRERILWLGMKIVKFGAADRDDDKSWLKWDSDKRSFNTSGKYHIDLEETPGKDTDTDTDTAKPPEPNVEQPPGIEKEHPLETEIEQPSEPEREQQRETEIEQPSEPEHEQQCETEKEQPQEPEIEPLPETQVQDDEAKDLK